MEDFDENLIVDFDENDNFLPFAGDLKDSFYKIEEIIDKNGFEKQKMEILKNVVNIVDNLVELGNVQEQIVLDTAQVYVLLKFTALDIEKLKDYFGKLVLEGASIMVKNFQDFEIYMKNIFENEDYRYLAKIKIADYIFELGNFSSKQEMKKSAVYNQAIQIIQNYGNRAQKGLMNKLKEIAV